MGTGVSGFLKLVKAIGEAADAVQKASARKSGGPADTSSTGSRTAQGVESVLEALDAELNTRRRTRKQSDRTARTAYYTLSSELGDEIRQVLGAEWKANRPIRDRYEAAARRLKNERNLLRIEPQREPLLDPLFAAAELVRDRAALDANLRARSAEMERVVAGYRVRAAREATELDPSGRLAADWLGRIEFESRGATRAVGESVGKTKAVMDSVERDLAALRGEIAQTASGVLAAPSDGNALASLRGEAVLGLEDLRRLAEAILNPGSSALKRLIDALLEERPGRRFADRPRQPQPLPEGLSATEAARLVAECFERAVVIDALTDMGYDKGEWFERAAAGARPSGTASAVASDLSAWSLVRALLNRILQGVEPGSIQFEGDDAERVGRALVLASECRRAPEPSGRRNWARLATGFHPLRAFDLDPAKAAERADLVDRLETAALRTIGKPLGDKQAGSFAFHHFALLAALRRSIGLTPRGPAAEAWERYIAERRARRAEIVSRVSPFWRATFEQLIDLPKSGGIEEERTLRAAFEPFAAMDHAGQAKVLDEVRALRADVRVSNSWDLVSRADDEQAVRPSLYSWSAHVLFRLEELLSRPAEEQAAYFMPPPDLPPLGDFAPMSASFGGDARDNIVDRDIVPLILDGEFEQAQAALHLWLERAPPSPLRDLVMASHWEDLSLLGWDAIGSRLAEPSTAAIGLDLSGHVTSELRDPGQPVPFETGRYTDRAFPFSTATLTALRAHGRSGREPWRGAFQDVDLALSITGMARVLLALRKFQHERRHDWPPELCQMHRAVERLALAWCFLCANRLVARDINTLGLPRPLPFLVGDHSFGLFPTAVHLPTESGAR
jgi:hypothetical protein